MVILAEPDRDAMGESKLERVTDGVGDADRAYLGSDRESAVVENRVVGHAGSLPVATVT
jgi:hypothetical protein